MRLAFSGRSAIGGSRGAPCLDSHVVGVSVSDNALNQT